MSRNQKVLLSGLSWIGYAIFKRLSGRFKSTRGFRKARKQAWDEDKYFRGYCEKQLAIIGEAASKLATEHNYESLDPETSWPLIKGLRNVLVHVYWKTDKDILW